MIIGHNSSVVMTGGNALRTEILRWTFYLLALSILSSSVVQGQNNIPDDVFLFSYFKGNGEDGLHLAYSFNGLAWEPLRHDSSFLTPTAGKDKLMRDPCIVRGPDGLFHMVWTVSWNEKGIGYANSEDLVHWSQQLYIPVMEFEPAARNCWAPEIFFDRQHSQYMVFWASTVTGVFPQRDTASENDYNHRIFYTTTKDFKSFRKSRVLYDPGFNAIDATIVKDGKQFVMFFKDERLHPLQKNIRVAISRRATGKYGPAGDPFTESWVEGPTVIKSKGRWIVFYDQYTRHEMGAMLSEDLVTWKDISDELKFPEGVRHGTILKITRSEFQRLLSPNQAGKR
jgi:hypothetical protein